MNKKALVFAALAALATGARADYTFDLTSGGNTTDSASTNAAYYAQTFSDASTTTTLKVTDGVIRIDVKWGSTGSYGSNAGILLPFNKMWSSIDFSKVTSIKFSYKTDDGTAAQFSCNSDLWTSVANGGNDGVVRTAALTSTSGSFSATEITPSTDLVWLTWMTGQHKAETTQSWDDVKTAIKNLQFQPMPENDSKGSVSSSHTSAYMEVKDITLVGTVTISSNFWEPAGTSACTGSKYTLLSDGSTMSPVTGTYWYDFTDTTSGKADTSNGTSVISDDGLQADGTNLGIEATLSRAAWQIYGGWADIGLNLAADGEVLAATGMTGISFDLQMGDADGAKWDADKISGVYFKVGVSGVADANQFYIGLSHSTHSSGNVCVATTDLKEPSWYTEKNTADAFNASKLTKLAWEMKIEKQTTSVTSATASQMWVGNVKLWGYDASGTGISAAKANGRAALVANYARGLVLSYALEGASAAHIDVVRLDGSKVASFSRSETSAQNLSLPVSLSQGTYLVVVKGGKTNLVAPVSVVR